MVPDDATDEDIANAIWQGAAGDDEDTSDLHPLFWTAAPGPDATDKQRAYEEALAGMIYDDRTPYQLAMDFKERGNTLYKKGKAYFEHAIAKYDEALSWARKAEPTAESRLCYGAILSNRAAINLALRNYGSVKRDCRAALRFGPSPPPNCKLFFRAATACMALEQYREAKEFVAAGLLVEPDSSSLRKIGVKADAAHEDQRRRARAKERKRMEERRRDESMRRACAKRNVTLGPLVMDVAQYTAQLGAENGTRCSGCLGGAPRPVEDGSGILHWPVVLMYPEHGQSDFIAEFAESCPLWQQLACIFPPSREESALAAEAGVDFAPWDPERRYTLDQVSVFFEEGFVRGFDMSRALEPQFAAAAEREHDPEQRDWGERRWVEVDVRCTLAEVLSHKGYVVPGIPVLHVLSRNSQPFFDDHRSKAMAGRHTKLIPKG